MTSDKDSNCIKELVWRYFKQFNELISPIIDACCYCFCCHYCCCFPRTMEI